MKVYGNFEFYPLITFILMYFNILKGASLFRWKILVCSHPAIHIMVLLKPLFLMEILEMP